MIQSEIRWPACVVRRRVIIGCEFLGRSKRRHILRTERRGRGGHGGSKSKAKFSEIKSLKSAKSASHINSETPDLPRPKGFQTRRAQIFAGSPLNLKSRRWERTRNTGRDPRRTFSGHSQRVGKQVAEIEADRIHPPRCRNGSDANSSASIVLSSVLILLIVA